MLREWEVEVESGVYCVHQFEKGERLYFHRKIPKMFRKSPIKVKNRSNWAGELCAMMTLKMRHNNWKIQFYLKKFIHQMSQCEQQPQCINSHVIAQGTFIWLIFCSFPRQIINWEKQMFSNRYWKLNKANKRKLNNRQTMRLQNDCKLIMITAECSLKSNLWKSKTKLLEYFSMWKKKKD